MAKQKWPVPDQGDLVDILLHGSLGNDTFRKYLYDNTGIWVSPNDPMPAARIVEFHNQLSNDNKFLVDHEYGDGAPDGISILECVGLIIQNLSLYYSVNSSGQVVIEMVSNISASNTVSRSNTQFDKPIIKDILIENKHHYLHVITKEWPAFVHAHVLRLAEHMDWYRTNITRDLLSKQLPSCVDQQKLDSYLSAHIRQLDAQLDRLTFKNMKRDEPT